MSQDSDPAAGPATEAAGIAAAESVEIDPAEEAGFVMGLGTRHNLNKLDALTAAIEQLHQREHPDPIQWCSNDLCRTLEEWR